MWVDGVSTVTSDDQRDLEKRVRAIYAAFVDNGIEEDDERLLMRRKDHAKYLYGGLGELPSGFSSLDASRPWICFWILHSLALLDQPLPSSPCRQSIIGFLASCQHPNGGFAGGPYQLAHLATTYAAVSALVTLGGDDALSVIDREALFAFLLSMCMPADRGGGMTMHQGGEVDIRGCYCALATCRMLGLDIAQLADACSLDHYVAACQSMEGGIGGEPGNEAHGGYAFCGFAALVLANRVNAVDVSLLASWASRMQGWMEGGFMGRTCKLVDGCYSLWQGGIFPLLSEAIKGAGAQQNKANSDDNVGDVVDGLLQIADIQGELASIRGLTSVPPLAMATAVAEESQERVDTAVEDSLRYEEAYNAEKAQHSDHAEIRKADALMALEEAADAQEMLDISNEHAESAKCSAVALLERYRETLGSTGDLQVDDLLMYDPLALQLWVLAACQVPGRGGLRDKPGKHPDYYHTCYCLSGLSSAQHASGHVLGGKRNALMKADPLCNVVADKVAAAREYFAENIMTE